MLSFTTNNDIITLMENFFNNRYVQLTMLGIGIAAFIYVFLWVLFTIIGIKDFPAFLHGSVAVLAAGYIVARYFSNRIG